MATTAASVLGKLEEGLNELSEEETGKLAALILCSGEVNRTVVQAFLGKMTEEDREEFLSQCESGYEE